MPPQRLSFVLALAASATALLPSAASAVAWPEGVTCDSTSALGRPYVEGLNCRLFRLDGEVRRFVVYVSPLAQARIDAGRKVPSVTMLHGTGGNGEEFYKRNGQWRQKADEVGFVALFPSSLSYLVDEDPARPVRQTKWAHWDLVNIVDETVDAPVDDIAFLRTMNADVRLNSSINRKRTYIAGFSNGAQMCFRAAVDMAYVYAAAACHVGSMVAVHSPAPPAPHIPVFDSIGNEDDNIVTAYQQFVPNATKFPMLPRLIANPGASADLSKRLESFGLATTPSNTLFANRKRYTLQWNTALPGNTDGNEYRFTMLDGVTHQYPAGAGQKDNTHDFKMTSLVYPFFAAHPKP